MSNEIWVDPLSKGVLSKYKIELIVLEVNTESVHGKGPKPCNVQANKQVRYQTETL
jgi:hypothetical protein